MRTRIVARRVPPTQSVAAIEATETSESGQPEPSSKVRHLTPAEGIAQQPSSGCTSNQGPPTKRTKITKVAKRGKKASLSPLLDMPPEVFNEIATHLLPMDLLSLARSNKFFRSLFMSRTAQHFWQKALANTPAIPSCPLDLNEPQYVSLIFSKTCSSCGVKVFRRMDPYLHVRLCNSCRDEQVVEIPTPNRLLQFLPFSREIKESRCGTVHTLDTEFSKIRDIAEQDVSEEAFSVWQKERYALVRERQKHSESIESYLNAVEVERELELEDLKRQRKTQIQTRLEEEGWSKEDMDLSNINRADWTKLIWQPKLITDRIWTNLYPKLVPLLESNRTHNQHADRETYRQERIKELHILVSGIQEALPPLVHLTLKLPSEDTAPGEPGTPTSTTSGQEYSSEDYPDVKIELPFPTMVELLTWPMIKRLVDTGTPPEDVETSFEEIRDEFDQAVVEWREKIERDLVEIWNANQDEVEDKSESSTSSEGEQTEGTNPQNSSGRAASDGDSPTESASCTTELVLPEFVATYTMPDGTTTTNISDLHPNLQLLLRADTTFFSSYRRHHTYPDIVPPAYAFDVIDGCPDAYLYGKRWDPTIIRRDDEVSAVSKRLLVWMGRPNASTADMKVLGAMFRCGRCYSALAENWDSLIEHYASEQRHWREAQAVMKSAPEYRFVFNSTHDFEPGNTKPFAHFMTPEEASDYGLEMYGMIMMRCLRCDDMAIDAGYFHASGLEFDSPIKEHLHDVHGVTGARFHVHFRQWDPNAQYIQSFESEEENEDSGEEF
ncbi:unnamed protein product [Rhizoctonia solani]|nr:unnamed protein product [Rhizoctonia solani]